MKQIKYQLHLHNEEQNFSFLYGDLGICDQFYLYLVKKIFVLHHEQYIFFLVETLKDKLHPDLLHRKLMLFFF